MTLGAPWATSWTSRYGPAVVTATGSILFGLGMALASFGTQVGHGVYVLTQLSAHTHTMPYLPLSLFSYGTFSAHLLYFMAHDDGYGIPLIQLDSGPAAWPWNLPQLHSCRNCNTWLVRQTPCIGNGYCPEWLSILLYIEYTARRLNKDCIAGTGIGGLVWAPITRILISTLGFRNALRIEGGIGFILIATAATVLRWDPEALSLRSTATTNATNTTRFGIPIISWRVVKSRVVVAKVSWCRLLLYSA
jgi:hypothetical protein